MAQQLIQDRSPAAYAGVEAYARAHAKEDAGALAWLVVGYAHVLDHDYEKAIDPLNRAKPLAGDLGDYVACYLGTSYLQTGHIPEALATLADFETAHPDSLLVRDDPADPRTPRSKWMQSYATTPPDARSDPPLPSSDDKLAG